MEGFMNDKLFNGARCGVIALAGGIVLACTASPEAFAQSCYNNSNPNLVKNGGFELGGRSNIPKWNVRWQGTLSSGDAVDPYVTDRHDNPHSGARELDIGTTLGANDISQPIK